MTRNHIVIMGDDFVPDATVGMPGLAVRTDGIWVPNCIQAISLCSPSRASLFSGQYACRHGVIHNESVPFPDDRSTLMSILYRARVDTMFLGKPSNVHYKTDAEGHELTGRAPNYRFPGCNVWHAMQVPGYYDLPLFEGRQLRQMTPGEYATDTHRDSILEWLDDPRRLDQPFFVAWLTGACHLQDEEMSAARYIGHFDGVDPVRTPNFNPPNDDDWATKASWLHESKPDPMDAAEILDVDDERRRAWGALLALDEALTAIIDKLTAVGLLDSTTIWVYADNGNHKGEQRLHAKNDPYKEAVDGHLWVRRPGATPRVERGLMSTVDIPTTIAAEMGAVFPHKVDGIDVRALIDYEERLRTALWCEGHTSGKKFREAVTDEWKYITYVDDEVELYDRVGDFWEMRNIAPEEPAQVAEMAVILDQIRPDVDIPLDV